MKKITIQYRKILLKFISIFKYIIYIIKFIVKKNQKILFIELRPYLNQFLYYKVNNNNYYWILKYWIPGFLTNFFNIKKKLLYSKFPKLIILFGLSSNTHIICEAQKMNIPIINFTNIYNLYNLNIKKLLKYALIYYIPIIENEFFIFFYYKLIQLIK